MTADRPVGLARMAAVERRYDVLPPWAWQAPRSVIARLEAGIDRAESLIRENDRALAENLTRIERLNARHRRDRGAFALVLARRRALLAFLRRTQGLETGR